MDKETRKFFHALRMEARRNDYHERQSDVHPLSYNTSKYFPRINTPKDKRNAA